METMVMLIVLAGGSLFAYRQWKAIQVEAEPRRIKTYPVKTELVGPEIQPAYTICVEPDLMRRSIRRMDRRTHRRSRGSTSGCFSGWPSPGSSVRWTSILYPLPGGSMTWW